jgi:hypothetical protein
MGQTAARPPTIPGTTPRVEGLAYYELLFKKVSYLLGINANDIIREANSMNYPSSRIIPGLRTLTLDDFTETLRVLVLIHQYLEQAPEEQEQLSGWIGIALENASIDIGVKWNEGMFYPTGAKELDERLIEEPFKWLIDFPNEKADYVKAITGYMNKRFDDVIINCYLVVEGVGRNVLNNRKTLDNNREELVKRIGLSQEWKSLLNHFIHYANEFKRHASEKRHDVKPIEVEAFLYMTGLLVRMIIELQKENSLTG